MSQKERHEEALQEAHNKGQTDASNGVYDLPSCCNPVTRTTSVFFGGVEEIDEIHDAYDAGHDHTESQKEENSGGCFLSAACMEHAGLSDDCRELTTLRSFRDNYVANLPNGTATLAEYYEVAPALVRQIKQSANRDTELAGIFATVTNAVELVEQGSCAEAFACYEAMFTDLENRYHE